MKATLIALGAIASVSCVNLQREPLLTWAPKKKDPGYPQDYFVPHFGADHDIASSFSNMAAAEGRLGAWVPK